MDLSIPVILKNNPMTFEEYCSTVENEERSSLDYLASGSPWNVPGSLTAKVSPRGELLPFYGDTVVMPLEKVDFSQVESLQAALHREVPELFAQELDPKHFHVTLHDLSNGPGRESLAEKMGQNREECRDIFEKTADYFNKNPHLSRIRLKSLYAYPSCNISVILGFVPAAEQDYRVLMNLCNLFDNVVYLDYWLRIHITLGYFKPYVFFDEQREALHKTLKVLGKGGVSIELDLWKLAYQHFNDMNDYRTQFSLGDFR